MTAAAGLVPGQIRALGITLGALYVHYAWRGLSAQIQARPEIHWATILVAALAWLPGVVALPAYAARRHDLGRKLLWAAAITYPIAILAWPLVAVRDDAARLDFWVHSMPGLAAVAAIITLPRALAWAALFVDTIAVELVMRELGIVVNWETSLVRLLFSVVHSGFFFVLVLVLLHNIDRGNWVMVRSGREQAELAMLQAREEEIARLDRLTHDFVLSLLSAGAEGVPTDKLRVQAETVQRQLSENRPDSDEVGSLEEMVDRIRVRCGGYGVPVETSQIPVGTDLPRQAAIEIEAAVEEAVRNTVRHATGGSRVHIQCAPDGTAVTVEVSDDGPGFDASIVCERLGVTQSILHRMNSLPGGSAQVDSAPGRGTTVTIAWSAP
ncbi:MAG: ATP-binding protein [Propionibacteriaceae bacterium]|nr:ATP-binding protein [Propionibacteriaceae bacterium]